MLSNATLTLAQQLQPGLSALSSVRSDPLMLACLAVVLTALYLLAMPSTPRITHARDTVQLLVTQRDKHTRVSLAALVKSQCPSLKRPFYPTPLLFNGHMQTFWAAAISKMPDLRADYDREMLDLPDGGLVAIDWAPRFHTELPSNSPIIIMLHGLAGGSRETYVLDFVPHALKHGYRVAALNFRGCGGVEIQTPQLYSGSFTDDVRHIVKYIHQQNPLAPLVGVGFSLGANILMKYVGEEGKNCLLTTAVSVGNPFDLHIGLAFLHSTWIGKELYSKVMTQSLIQIYKKHQNRFEKSPNHPTHTGPIQTSKILNAKYLPDFDELATRRVFGFRSVSEYYRMGSSAQYIPDVAIPTLLLSDLDDPIAVREAIPVADVLQNPNIILAVTQRGGHLGWFEGIFAPKRWFPTPVIEYVNAVVQARQALPDHLQHKFVQQPHEAKKMHVHYGQTHNVLFPVHSKQPSHSKESHSIGGVDVGTMTDSSNAEAKKPVLKSSTFQTTDIHGSSGGKQSAFARIFKYLTFLSSGQSLEAQMLGRFVALVLTGCALLLSTKKYWANRKAISA
ncbi:hypothetical protein HDU77_000231 [Chytriomyces hyalinus]|nr:hypothetical protein HDU77_000231 [Chytriomyces hyalinus]